jgi:putative transposase
MYDNVWYEFIGITRGQFENISRHLLGPVDGLRQDWPYRSDVIELATTCGRSGYRRIAALLREAGWVVNVKRVERILRQEGLKLPPKQPKRGRLWLNDGS